MLGLYNAEHMFVNHENCCIKSVTSECDPKHNSKVLVSVNQYKCCFRTSKEVVEVQQEYTETHEQLRIHMCNALGEPVALKYLRMKQKILYDSIYYQYPCPEVVHKFVRDTTSMLEVKPMSYLCYCLSRNVFPVNRF